MDDRYVNPHIHHHRHHRHQPLTSDDTAEDSDGKDNGGIEIHFLNSPENSEQQLNDRKLGLTPVQIAQLEQIRAMQAQLSEEEIRDQIESHMRSHMSNNHHHHSHHHHHHHNHNHSNEEENENDLAASLENEYKIVIAFKIVAALIYNWLKKLTPTTRLINKILFCHFILSLTNISYYIQLCPISITQSYQIWRIITYPFAESNIFLCIFGILIFSDVIQRLEYKFGSIWALYLVLLNWILIGILSLSFALFLANLFELDMEQIYSNIHNNSNTIVNSNNSDTNDSGDSGGDNGNSNGNANNKPYSFTVLESIILSCQCVGLYPLILNLTLIESFLINPREIDALFFGFCYVPNYYIPIVWTLIYCIFVRWDLAMFTVLIFTMILLKIGPLKRIYHLSMYRVKRIELLKRFETITKDELFVAIVDINQDQWVATRRYVTYDTSCHNSGQSSPLPGISVSRDGKTISVRNNLHNKNINVTKRRRNLTNNNEDSLSNVIGNEQSQSRQSDSDDSQNETLPFIHGSSNNAVNSRKR